MLMGSHTRLWQPSNTKCKYVVRYSISAGIRAGSLDSSCRNASRSSGFSLERSPNCLKLYTLGSDSMGFQVLSSTSKYTVRGRLGPCHSITSGDIGGVLDFDSTGVEGELPLDSSAVSISS